jgi:pentatricopeptide repeat protein
VVWAKCIWRKIQNSTAAHSYAKAGDRDKALEILHELERRSSQDYELAFQIAQIYLGLDD